MLLITSWFKQLWHKNTQETFKDNILLNIFSIVCGNRSLMSMMPQTEDDFGGQVYKLIGDCKEQLTSTNCLQIVN